ncbi:aminoglycoside phosphotransferase family protein [Flindersiella endophytica]
MSETTGVPPTLPTLPALPPTKAMGVRAPYDALSARVATWIERTLGSSVVRATTQHGGFSPGVAARVLCANGRRAFVKAVGTSLNPDTPRLFRQEVLVMKQLPWLSCVPRLYATYDDGDWVALVMEDIAGRQPSHPWTRAEVDLVFGALGELTAALTPSPWASAPRLSDQTGAFGSWALLAEDPPADLDPWLVDHLGELVAYGERGLRVTRGETLAHWDIRADNTLLTDSGRVVFVDWAWGCLAAPWVDVAAASIDLPLSGSSVDVDRLLAEHPFTRDVDPDDITSLIASVCGALQSASRRPVPAGLPTIREYQRLVGETLLRLVKQRTGW